MNCFSSFLKIVLTYKIAVNSEYKLKEVPYHDNTLLYNLSIKNNKIQYMLYKSMTFTSVHG